MEKLRERNFEIQSSTPPPICDNCIKKTRTTKGQPKKKSKLKDFDPKGREGGVRKKSKIFLIRKKGKSL